MDQKIGIYARIQSIARDLLQLEGGSDMPTRMSTAPVQAVVDILRAGGDSEGAGTVEYYLTQSLAINGLTNANVKIVGNDNLALGAVAPLETGNLRVDHIWARLDFDAAGAIAFNTKQLALTVELCDIGGDPPGQFPVIDHRALWTVRTGITVYTWSLRGSGQIDPTSGIYTDSASTWKGRLSDSAPSLSSNDPTAQGLALRVRVVDGTALPAATVIQIFAGVRRGAPGRGVPPE